MEGCTSLSNRLILVEGHHYARGTNIATKQKQWNNSGEIGNTGDLNDNAGDLDNARIAHTKLYRS